MKTFRIVILVIQLLAIAGYIQCVYKAINCNWEPIGKAEIIYTGGLFTGLGAIVGWLDIEDK